MYPGQDLLLSSAEWVPPVLLMCSKRCQWRTGRVAFSFQVVAIWKNCQIQMLTVSTSCPPPHPGYDTGGGLESLVPYWAWSPGKSVPFPLRLCGMSQLAMLVDFSRTFACSQKWHHLLKKRPSVISLIAFSPFSELDSMLDHFLSTKCIYFPLSSQIPKVCSDRSQFGLKPIPYFLC